LRMIRGEIKENYNIFISCVQIADQENFLEFRHLVTTQIFYFGSPRANN
jgi:hypothetical protein